MEHGPALGLHLPGTARLSSAAPSAQNKVLALLGVAATAVLLGLPWLTTAPNRMVSGQAIYFVSLLTGPMAWAVTAGFALLAVLLVRLCWQGASRPLLLAVLALATALIPSLWLLAGLQAAGFAVNGSSAAKTALASGFWTANFMLGLLVHEALGRLRAGYLLRAAVGLAVVGCVAGLWGAGAGDQVSLMQELASRGPLMWAALGRHAVIVGASLAVAVVIGLPLGLWAHHSALARRVMLPALNLLQTIPSLALFGLLMAPLAWLGSALPAWAEGTVSGIGLLPAVIALTLYALLPVVRGVVAGMGQVPIGMQQAAQGLGLSAAHTLRWVTMPLALPVVLAGVRTAAVQLVGLAAVAALIGAGGLGAVLFEGLFSAAQDVVVLAVVPIVAMGAGVDAVFSGLARLTRVARVQALVALQGRGA